MRMSFSVRIPLSSSSARLVPFSRGCAGVYQWVPSERAMLAMECLSAGLVSQSECRRMRRAGQRGSSAVRVRRFCRCSRWYRPASVPAMHVPHGVGGVAEVFNTFFTIHYACLDDARPGDACSHSRETTDNRTVAAVCFPARSGRGYRSASGCGGKGCRPFRGRCVWFQ